ncbi:DNA-directed RNA polymerase II subunit RPB11 [Entamoeba marina]
MNAPDLDELYNMQPGEKKIECEENIQNTAKFTLIKEDHTIGNLLRVQLLNDKDVLFAGYRNPHPLTNKIEITIRTNGNVSPKTALENAINALIEEIDIMGREFNNKVLDSDVI